MISAIDFISYLDSFIDIIPQTELLFMHMNCSEAELHSRAIEILPNITYRFRDFNQPLFIAKIFRGSIFVLDCESREDTSSLETSSWLRCEKNSEPPCSIPETSTDSSVIDGHIVELRPTE